MRGIKRGRPSPSMIVAGAALVVALAGTAIAGPLASKSILSKSEKKQTKKIARSAAKGEIAKAGLKTSSAFTENSNPVLLNGTFQDVAATTITTLSSGRILATGLAELIGADADELAGCRLQIDGANSIPNSSQPDDIGTGNDFVIPVNFAVTRAAGTYTARMQCLANSGTVSASGAAINVYGLGA